MDREGDSYALLAHLSCLDQAGFVVRLGQNRRLSGERAGTYLRQALPEAVHLTTRRVPLTRRATGSRHHSARRARNAVLELRAMQLTIERPDYADRRTSASSSLPKSLSLHIVHVLERHPPRGIVPVQWLLATLEPIETPEQVEEIVDFYCARWVIGASCEGRMNQSVKVRPGSRDSRPRSSGGTVAREQDGEALRQQTSKGGCATHQVAA